MTGNSLNIAPRCPATLRYTRLDPKNTPFVLDVHCILELESSYHGSPKRDARLMPQGLFSTKSLVSWGIFPFVTRAILFSLRPPGLQYSQVYKSSDLPLIWGFGTIDFRVTDVPSAPLVGSLVSRMIALLLYIPSDGMECFSSPVCLTPTTPSTNDGKLQADTE